MMRLLMNVVHSGRSSYDASIHVPLPAYHHWHDAPPLIRATACNPIPDKRATIVCSGGVAPSIVAAVNRTDGRAYPAHQDGRLSAARSKGRPWQTQPLFEGFVRPVRDGALSTSTIPRNRATDRVRAWKPLFSAGSLRRYKRHNSLSSL